MSDTFDAFDRLADAIAEAAEAVRRFNWAMGHANAMITARVQASRPGGFRRLAHVEAAIRMMQEVSAQGCAGGNVSTAVVESNMELALRLLARDIRTFPCVQQVLARDLLRHLDHAQYTASPETRRAELTRARDLSMTLANCLQCVGGEGVAIEMVWHLNKALDAMPEEER